jgi:4-hydroxy-tetrahydrodipicolinate synthase
VKIFSHLLMPPGNSFKQRIKTTMTSHILSGVYAAAVTPLKANYSLDLDSVLALLDFLALRGCHGAVIFGTTGEGPSFSPTERTTLMRVAVKIKESHPDFRLLAGTGTPSMAETIELNGIAFDLGYDGVVCLPPYYFRKATDEGLYNWFKQVIKASVPADGFLLGYHFPSVAGIGFSIPLLTRLKESFPSQFAGIKDSSHDADLAHNLGDLFGQEMLVLTGTDSYMQLAMENAAGGCITAPANLISPHLRALWDARVRGEDVTAIQKRITKLRDVLDRYAPFPPSLKALLARIHKLPRWSVRPPLDPISADMEAQAVDEFLQAENA